MSGIVAIVVFTVPAGSFIFEGGYQPTDQEVREAAGRMGYQYGATATVTHIIRPEVPADDAPDQDAPEAPVALDATPVVAE